MNNYWRVIKKMPKYTDVWSLIQQNPLLVYVHFHVISLLIHIQQLIQTAKVILVLTLRASLNELICDAGIVTRTGRKWSATETVRQAESSLKHKDIVGTTVVGRQGIGATKTLLWSRSDQKERRYKSTKTMYVDIHNWYFCYFVFRIPVNSNNVG